MSPEIPQILQNLEAQLNHRLEKLWRVFNWCSSILISITGGIIVATRAIDKFKLYTSDRVVLSLIVFIISYYAWQWIQENLTFETNVRNQIDQIFEQELKYPQLKALRPDKAKFGYKAVIALLGLVALTACWLDVIFK